MEVSLTYENTPSLHKGALAAITKYAGMTRRLWLMVWAVPVIMTVTAALNARNRASLSAFGAAVVPWWILYPLLFGGLMRWSIARSARRRLADDATQRGEQRRRIDEAGLHIQNAAMSAQVAWQAIHHAVETPEFFLIFQNRDCAYALPKASLAAGDASGVRSLLQSHLGERARVLTV